MNRTLGIFKGIDSNFFVEVQKGIPMIRVQNGIKIGHLHFDNLGELELFMEQLGILKRYFVEKRKLSLLEEKRIFGNLA